MLKFRKIKEGAFISITTLILFACGNGNDGDINTAPAPVDVSELPELGDFSETVDLHLSGSFTQGNIEDDNWVQQKLEEQFNVNIENTKIDTWNNDEASIMIASGDLPGAFAFTGDNQTAEELYKDGLTRTIPRDMIEKYAPNYTNMLNEVDNGLGWDLNQHPESEDEYLALTGYQGNTNGLTWTPTLRLDWMENLGMDLPDDMEPIGDSDGYERIFMTTESLTLDELEEILTAFTLDDPDGNGKNDTHGIMPWNSDLNWAASLLGAHGISASYNIEEDGQLTDPMISDAYKDFLLLLSDWYSKGLIDPEWTTLTTQTSWDKFASGTSGYVVAQPAYLAQEGWTNGRAPQNILEADPDAKLLAFAPETGENGEQGIQAFTPVTLLSQTLQISADVSDEELARYLQIFDFINFGEEGAWANYGIPGEHSDWAGEEGNSALIVRDEYPREEGDMGFWGYSFRVYYEDRLTYLEHPVALELKENYFVTPEANELRIQPYKWDLFNETDFADVESRYSAQLQTIEDEFRMNAIVGAIDIEEEWDSYVENWLNNGGQELLDELEKAPVVTEILAE